MKCAMVTLAASLIFVTTAVSQDLPPEVLLLSRVKRHTKEELERLPNISCLETVHRDYQPARGKLRPLDTVRLEVFTSGDKELFASPGDRRFSERHPMSYAGSGTLGDGFFGLYLKDILVNGRVSYAYKGEEAIGGRRLARWDYRLPLMWSGQIIRLPEGSGTVGLHGSFWAEPQTGDVIRLEVNGDDFPPTLPITEAAWNINYERTALGDNAVVLIPRSGEFRMVKFSGETSHNGIEFTHCRVFGAQSAIDFDAPDSAEHTPSFGVVSIDDTLRPLPGGLQIAVKLRSRISADMAVGALITGVVAGKVSGKGAVVIVAGSPVRGRIRLLERYADPFPHFVVALEFTEVELQGIRYLFYADLVEVESAPGVEQTLSTPSETEEVNLLFGGRRVSRSWETLSIPRLPGVAIFFFKGSKLELPQDFRTVWKTRVLAP